MPELNTHYHLNGVCREHGMAPLEVIDTLEGVRTRIADRFDGELEKKYASVEYRGYTLDYFEADVVDRNGYSHTLFFTYATHRDTEVTPNECRAQQDAVRMMEEMEAAMRAVFGRGEIPRDPEAQEDTLPTPDELDAFLNDLFSGPDEQPNS